MPSYNKAAYLRQSIDSVLCQNYPSLEFIVVDGASTDGTREILKSYGTRIRWVSEKDGGQADALNKGIAMAGGEIIGWLNADDLYESGALEAVGKYFAEHPDRMWLTGLCSIIDEHGREIRKWITRYKDYHVRRYCYGALVVQNIISQMATFMRKSVFETAGPFNTQLVYTMDYDMWLRIGKVHSPGILDRKLAKFRMYAETKSYKGFYRQFKESYDLAKKHAADQRTSLILHRLHRIKIVSVYTLLVVLKNLTTVKVWLADQCRRFWSGAK